MEQISWTDRVRNEEILLRVKEQRNIQHVARMKVNWIGQILYEDCLSEQIVEGKIERRGRRGRRRKQLLDNLKENISYWKLKEEALDRSL
jgi:hypothetical protein